MRDAALQTIAAVWWAPAITLAVAPALAVSWGVDLRLRHARRLAAAGRLDAALRLYAAVQATSRSQTCGGRRGRRGCAVTRFSVRPAPSLRHRLLALALPAP